MFQRLFCSLLPLFVVIVVTYFSPSSANNAVNYQFYATPNSSLGLEIQRAFPPEMFAAAFGDINDLQYLLRNRWRMPRDGVDVRDWVGQTPLHLAAKFGKMATAQYLIQIGANVNARNTDFDETPLHLAAKSGYTEMVKLLIRYGADANAAIVLKSFHFEGGTPMTYGIDTANSLDVVKALVEEGGASVTKPNLDGSTPLHLAVGHQNVEMAKYLLAKGADINVKDMQERTPLNYLLSKGFVIQLPMIAFLIKNGADVEAQDRVGRTPIQNAVIFSHSTVVDFLLQHGANINSRGTSGRTVLHRVVALPKIRSIDTVKFLLERGADPRLGTPDFCDLPLHDLADVSREEYEQSTDTILTIARYLINYGADPNYIEPCSATSAIDIAMNNNYVSLVEVMLHPQVAALGLPFMEQRPAASNESEITERFTTVGTSSLEDIVRVMAPLPVEKAMKRDWLNQTALHVASYFGRSIVAMTLTLFGFDIEARDNYERTPLHNAAQIGDTESIQYLLSRNASINTRDAYGQTPLALAVLHSSSSATVKLLLSKGADPNIRSFDGMSLLHHAVTLQHLEIMELLISYGVGPNEMDNENATVLNYLMHSWCCYPQVPTVGLLIRSGAKVNLPNARGYTPLHGAIISKKGPDVMLLLLYYGADPNVVNSEGCSSPIQLFAKYTLNDYSLSEEQMASTARWMVRFGANPYLGDKCNNNLSPVYIAERAGKWLVADALRGL